jgi:hypothetical protein
MILHARRDLAGALNNLGPRLGEVAEPLVGVLADPVGERPALQPAHRPI